MPFKREEVSRLLADCHRRCCICFRFCGSKIETDHIEPRAESHDDNIDNAIPVCFECHAEIHSYNNKHPKGRKFDADELRAHKANWLTICKDHPEALVSAAHDIDIGPLEALLSEIEFNCTLARVDRKRDANPDLPPQLVIEQFTRAIRGGAILTLDEEHRAILYTAYSAIIHANQQTLYASQQPWDSHKASGTIQKANRAVEDAASKLAAALVSLRRFLGHSE